MPSRRRGTRPLRAKPAKVFLNIPYDDRFEPLFLAYIAGISAFGLVPRATLEIPGSTRRLERIFSLIQECSFSVHDLSRVQLDRTRPSTPRFNMPFELGLCVGWERTGGSTHAWFVCESMRYRLEKSLSDLAGTDVYIHNATVSGVFRELGNAFVRASRQPTVQQMWLIYRALRSNLRRVLHETGNASPFSARPFKELSVLASAAADKVVA